MLMNRSLEIIRMIHKPALVRKIVKSPMKPVPEGLHPAVLLQLGYSGNHGISSEPLDSGKDLLLIGPLSKSRII